MGNYSVEHLTNANIITEFLEAKCPAKDVKQSA